MNEWIAPALSAAWYLGAAFTFTLHDDVSHGWRKWVKPFERSGIWLFPAIVLSFIWYVVTWPVLSWMWIRRARAERVADRLLGKL